MKFTSFAIETYNPQEENDFVFDLDSKDILNQEQLEQLNDKLSAVIDNLRIDRVLTAVSQYMVEADYIRDNWSRTQFKIYYEMENEFDNELYPYDEIITYQDVLKYTERKHPVEKFVDSLLNNHNLHPFHQATFVEMQKYLIQEALPKAIQEVKDSEAAGKVPFFSKYYFTPLITAIAKATNDAFDNQTWNIDEVTEFAKSLVTETPENN